MLNQFPANKNEKSHAYRRQISGVLLLDKPYGLSSNAALQKVKRIFGATKAGHAGTLDPLATGLIPILFGEATKFSSFLLDADKRYKATLQLGVKTATGDAEGEVVERREVDCSLTEVLAVLDKFSGIQAQTPPMYSALKMRGTPLYVLARRGETVDRVAREINIKRLTVESFDSDELELDVICSKGTYIRTLAEDIGEALGCGAHLQALRRTAAGDLLISDAHELEAIANLAQGDLDKRLLPPDRVLAHLDRVELTSDEARRFGYGQVISGRTDNGPSDLPIRVYSGEGNFLGLATIDAEGLVPKRLLSTPQAQGQASENDEKTCKPQ